MNDASLQFNATHTGDAYDRLDRAINAARRLATESPHRPLEGSTSSAVDELAYLLTSQFPEEALNFAHYAFRSQVPDDQPEPTKTQNPAPSANLETDKDKSALALVRSHLSGPWLQLVVPGVIMAQVVGAVALVTVWTPGLLSESLAQVLSRKGRITIHTPSGGTVLAQADSLVSDPLGNKAVAPATPPSRAVALIPAAATPVSADLPAPASAQPTASAVLPFPSANDSVLGPLTAPPSTAESAAVNDEVDRTADQSTPEQIGISLPLPPSAENLPVSDGTASVSPAANASEDVAPAVPERLDQDSSSTATVSDEHYEKLTPAAETPSSISITEETQGAATPPDVPSSNGDRQDAMSSPEVSLSPSQEAASAPSLSMDENSPASNPVVKLVEMVEALAKERQTALMLERERADALARELALVREELGALRLRPPVSWIMTAHPPIPTPEPQQAPDFGTSPRETAERAPAAVHAKVPAPSDNNPADSAPSPSPPPPRASSSSVQHLIDRAEALLRVRDISGARLLLERAAERGSARGTYLLAQTYDPSLLAHWQVRGIIGDPEKAQKLYGQSRTLAVNEAAGTIAPH